MKKRIFARSVAFLLVMLFSFSLPAPIAYANYDIEYFTEERSSAFISSTTVAMTAQSNGVVSIRFTITGTRMMDQIGATRIQIFENGNLVRTINTTTNPGIMARNTNFHTSTLTHQGVVGRNYHAVVIVQAGVNGNWDNRTLTSPTAVARW